MKNSNLQLKDVVLQVPNQDLSSGDPFALLIDDLTVDFQPGKMYAFMGTSGSGKTTTMETISALVPSGSKTSGSILIEGLERDPDQWGRNHAYGKQEAYGMDNLTLEEFVSYSISFYFPDESKENINQVMDTVLNDVLNLGRVRRNQMNQLSGGEQKRVGLAVTFAKMLLLQGQLKVSLLDEPTSELDSGMAVKVIRFLKDYAQMTGSIVITTVHQPGPEVFSTFDNLLFLHKGSKIYLGPADGFMNFLNSKGIYNPGSESSNMEFLFSLFTPGTRESEKYKDQLKEIENEIREEKLRKGKKEKRTFRTSEDTKINFVPNFHTALLLVKRQLTLDCFRSKEFLVSTVILLLIVGYFLLQGLALKGIPFPLTMIFISFIPFSNTILNRGIRYSKEEMDRRLYDTATLWLAALILELIMIFIRCTIAVGIMFAFGHIGLEHLPFLYISHIFLLFLNSLPAMMVVSLVDTSTTIGKVLPGIILVVRCFSMVCLFKSLDYILKTLRIPSLISKLIQSILNFPFSNFLLKIIICPQGFLFQKILEYYDNDAKILEIFSNDFLQKCKADLSKASGDQVDASSTLSGLKEAAEEFKKIKASSYLQANPENFPFVILVGVISFIVISIISIIFLDKRFSPSVRFQLSEDENKDKSLQSRLKSLTKGSWLKRFLVVFGMVLGITAIALIILRSFPFLMKNKEGGGGQQNSQPQPAGGGQQSTGTNGGTSGINY
ncbi:White ABC transporter [Encephalitozoon intestinalis ATCC 50506]|uniref:White ABC transporter n=1 Tax=Encephalitozoon intestinalis (strain ATCC 50506) TaxID=876142 RepID=E0S7F0_ENCIT|nr:White ABC transporter [Encephalitozoon intestinalis ATCC 50506]ADM11629.1 White ABC transporter [Encephalitozoon intestinalis ATCC 50506]UTX45361.1 ABC transporter [Encephalitozoon intestinalis]